MASTAIKISYEPEPKVEYYLFTEKVYHGKEDTIFIQVFPDGTVRSKEVPFGSYKPEELFEMAAQFSE